MFDVRTQAKRVLRVREFSGCRNKPTNPCGYDFQSSLGGIVGGVVLSILLCSVPYNSAHEKRKDPVSELKSQLSREIEIATQWILRLPPPRRVGCGPARCGPTRCKTKRLSLCGSNPLDPRQLGGRNAPGRLLHEATLTQVIPKDTNINTNNQRPQQSFFINSRLASLKYLLYVYCAPLI